VQDKGKVVILTYFYPPCILTASQRVLGWAKYLNEYGYQPVIITRNWDIPIKKQQDVLLSAGESPRVESHAYGEVHYVPYKASIRDRLYKKVANSPLAFLSKIFTFLEIAGQNFSNLFIPYSNLYEYARTYLKAHPEVKKVIVTANPFPMFRFGYLLKKEFDIEWIADYRDPWNTLDSKVKSDYLSRTLFQSLEIRSEKKWLSNCAFFTSVSQGCVEDIAPLIGKQGHILFNGFFEEEFPDSYTKQEPVDEFIVVYNGTLYPVQKIEIFLEAFKRVVDKYRDTIVCKMYFPGLSFDKSQDQRVRQCMKGYEAFVKITERIPKQEVLDLQKKASALLIIGLEIKGLPTSKLFEYVGVKRPVILCPSDYDIIEQIVLSTGLGYVCVNSEEAFQALDSLVQNYIQFGYAPVQVNEKERSKYSRRNKTGLLAGWLDVL